MNSHLQYCNGNSATMQLSFSDDCTLTLFYPPVTAPASAVNAAPMMVLPPMVIDTDLNYSRGSVLHIHSETPLTFGEIETANQLGKQFVLKHDG